jgi:formylglycine-generating enzyme required for sulfatase activity
MQQTQHNVFVRKFSKMAIVITVTDWEDFKELEKHSTHEDPDFLIGAVTSKNIYTNMNPSIVLGIRGEVKDITEETCGAGIEGILTGHSPAGPLWQYRKIEGLYALDEFVTPDIK